jgi:hypothetical protein
MAFSLPYHALEVHYTNTAGLVKTPFPGWEGGFLFLKFKALPMPWGHQTNGKGG